MEHQLGIIIQARMGATRLPNKLLLPFYQSLTVLDILLTKLQQQFSHLPIVLATTTNSKDDAIVDVVKKYPLIQLFRGDEQDVLKRFIDAAESNHLAKIIRICADNPFLDMHYLQFLIENAANTDFDYVSFVFPAGNPTIKSHIGLFTEYTTLDALKRVATYTSESLYKEHVTNYIYVNPDKFNFKLFDLPEFLKHRTDIRLTLDTPNDFEVQQQLFAQMMQLFPNSQMNFEAESLVNEIDKNEAYLTTMKVEIVNNSK